MHVLTTLWILALLVISIPVVIVVFVNVHHVMNRVCLRHANKFCEKSRLEVGRMRFQPARDRSGIKTEFTLMQVDCRDAQNERKLIVLLVWPFGVRKVLSNDRYPDSLDEQWL